MASPAWLWLNLQKVFHRVSTRVNCRLTITSSMAWQNPKRTSYTSVTDNMSTYRLSEDQLHWHKVGKNKDISCERTSLQLSNNMYFLFPVNVSIVKVTIALPCRLQWVIQSSLPLTNWLINTEWVPASLTNILSVSYLTVFSVQQLKALYVLQLNALWQRLPLEVDVWELWESSGCIWNTRHKNTGYSKTNHIKCRGQSVLTVNNVVLYVFSQ